MVKCFETADILTVRFIVFFLVCRLYLVLGQDVISDCVGSCSLPSRRLYLRNEFHFCEVYRSANYIGLLAK